MTTHAMTMTPQQDGSYLCHCQTCGRRLVLDLDTGQRAVLIEGDASAIHTGGVGELRLDAQVVEPRLAPFERWAQEHGL